MSDLHLWKFNVKFKSIDYQWYEAVNDDCK